MAHSTVTHVPFMHVTKSGHCAFCGTRLKLCGVCGFWFHAPTERKESCSDRCRTEKSRKKIRDELELDDE